MSSLILSADYSASQAGGVYVVNNSNQPYITFFGYGTYGEVLNILQPTNMGARTIPSAPIQFISPTTDVNGNCIVVIQNNIYNIQTNAESNSLYLTYLPWGTNLENIPAPSNLSSIYFPTINACPFYYVTGNSNDIYIYNTDQSTEVLLTISSSSITTMSGKYVPDVYNNGTQPINLYGYGKNTSNNTCIFVVPDVTNSVSYVFSNYMPSVPNINTITFTSNYQNTEYGVLYYVYDLSNQIVAYDTQISITNYTIIYTHTTSILYLDWNYYNNVTTNQINYVLCFLDDNGLIFQYDISMNFLFQVGSGLSTSAAIMWPVEYSTEGYSLICTDISNYTFQELDSSPCGTTLCNVGLYSGLINSLNPYYSSVCKLSPIYDPNTNFYNVYSLMLNTQQYGIDLFLNIYDQSGNQQNVNPIILIANNPLWSISVESGNPYDCYVSDLYNTYHYTYSTTNQQFTLVSMVDFSSVCATSCSSTPWTINNSYVYNNIIYYLDWFSSLYQYNYNTSTCSCDNTWNLITQDGRYGILYGINENSNLVINGTNFSDISLYTLRTFSLINTNQFVYIINNESSNPSIICSTINALSPPTDSTYFFNYDNAITSFDSVLINNVPMGIFIDSSQNIWQCVISNTFFNFNQLVQIYNSNNTSIYGFLTCVPYSLSSFYTDGLNIYYYPLFPLSPKPLTSIPTIDENGNVILCNLFNGVITIELYSQPNYNLLTTWEVQGEFQGYITGIYSSEAYICNIYANNQIYVITWNYSSTSPLSSSSIFNIQLPSSINFPVILYSGIMDNSGSIIYSVLNSTELFDQSGNKKIDLEYLPSWITYKNGYIYGYFVDNSNNSYAFGYNPNGTQIQISQSFQHTFNPYCISIYNNCVVYTNLDNPTTIWSLNILNGKLYPIYQHTMTISSLDADTTVTNILSYIAFLDISGSVNVYTDFNPQIFNIANNLNPNGVVFLSHINQYLIYCDCSAIEFDIYTIDITTIKSSAIYDPITGFTSCFTIINGVPILNILGDVKLMGTIDLSGNISGNAIQVYALTPETCYVCDQNNLYILQWLSTGQTSGYLQIINQEQITEEDITDVYIYSQNNTVYYLMGDSLTYGTIYQYSDMSSNAFINYNDPIIWIQGNNNHICGYTYNGSFNLFYDTKVIANYNNNPTYNSAIILTLPQILIYINPDNPVHIYQYNNNATTPYASNPENVNNIAVYEAMIGLSYVFFYGTNLSSYVVNSFISEPLPQFDVSNNQLFFSLPNTYSIVYTTFSPNLQPLAITFFGALYMSPTIQSSIFNPLTNYTSVFQADICDNQINISLLIYNTTQELLAIIPLTGSIQITNTIQYFEIISPYSCIASTNNECYLLDWNGIPDNSTGTLTASISQSCKYYSGYNLRNKYGYLFGYDIIDNQNVTTIVYQYDNQIVRLNQYNGIGIMTNISVSPQGILYFVDPTNNLNILYCNIANNSTVSNQVYTHTNAIISLDVISVASLNEGKIQTGDILFFNDSTSTLYSYSTITDISTNITTNIEGFINTPVNLYSYIWFNNTQETILNYVEQSLPNQPIQTASSIDISTNHMNVINIFIDGTMIFNVYDISSAYLLTTLDLTNQPYAQENIIYAYMTNIYEFIVCTTQNIYTSTYTGPNENNWGDISSSLFVSVPIPTDCTGINISSYYTNYALTFGIVMNILSDCSNVLYSIVPGGEGQNIFEQELSGNIIWINGSDSFVYGYCTNNLGQYNIFLGQLNNPTVYPTVNTIYSCTTEPTPYSMIIINSDEQLFIFIDPDNPKNLILYNISDPNGLVNPFYSSGTTTGYGFITADPLLTLTVNSDDNDNWYIYYISGSGTTGNLWIIDISGNTYTSASQILENINIIPGGYLTTILGTNNYLIYTDNITNKFYNISQSFESINLYKNKLGYIQEYVPKYISEYKINNSNNSNKTNKWIIYILIIILIIILFLMLYIIFKKLY